MTTLKSTRLPSFILAAATLTISQVANAFPSYLAGTSGNQAQDVNLMGTVKDDCTIYFTPLDSASSLNVQSGEYKTDIAHVKESCNSKYGYEVSIISLNNGRLNNIKDSTSYSKYSVQYDNYTVNFSKQIAMLRKQPVFQREMNLSITITGQNMAKIGDYTDDLYLIIKGK